MALVYKLEHMPATPHSEEPVPMKDKFPSMTNLLTIPVSSLVLTGNEVSIESAKLLSGVFCCSEMRLPWTSLLERMPPSLQWALHCLQPLLQPTPG